MKGCLLYLCLVYVLPVCAQQGSYEMFDFYYVLTSGDTIREHIAEIRILYTKDGQMASVTHNDGTVSRLGVAEIKAFSFIIPNYAVLWKHYAAVYHQVQIIEFTEKPSNTKAAVFFETIAACNGHILYRDFADRDEGWRYLLAKGMVIIKLLPTHNIDNARAILLPLMPDCMQTIDWCLWPKWARRHYKGSAPEKPNIK